MLALLLIFVMLIQSGCSLTADRYIERYLGNNSICWEDNDHILIYASIAQYWYNQDVIGGPSKEYDWVGGEIWRITASTGAKELLFREKGDKYWAWDNTTGMRINAINGNIYICDVLFTYKVRDDFSEWDSLGSFTLPNVSSDEKYLVGIDEDGDVKVKKYNLENNTSEELYVNDELITWLDYDYDRNYLLINSNKFVDLNTGQERIIIEERETIDSFQFIHPDLDSRNGRIRENNIQVDIGDKKVFIDLSDMNNKWVKKGVLGILSTDDSKYAVPGLFTDTLGDTISQWSIPFDEL
jgi:hypothetical protein